MRSHRRDFIKAVGYGLFGLPMIGTSFFQKVSGSEINTNRNKLGQAKSVIQIWMWGGPSQLDTFDPKPGAGRNYCGPWDRPISTNVPNIEINQTLPCMAKCADLYSIVRSMTHGTNHHEQASYIMQTGRMQGGNISCPSVGAVIAKVKGYDAGYDLPIPPYVVLTTGQGRFSESGFLGQKYKPFITGGDPAKTPFLVSGYVVEGMTEKRQYERLSLLESLDTIGKINRNEHLMEELKTAKQNASRLILGNAAKIFDLSSEPDKIREEYGMNWFGQSCLMARRLVQYGIPYITINYRGWDTHKRHFETLTTRQSQWDQGMATLLKELADSGLLDTTIIWWGGEFGRTPKIGWESPWFGGRGHYAQCFSVVLAGGGFRGGKVIGASNETGEKVVSRPVAPQDLLGSMYQMLGIDPDSPMKNDKGINIPYMPPASNAGRLNEIMQ